MVFGNPTQHFIILGTQKTDFEYLPDPCKHYKSHLKFSLTFYSKNVFKAYQLGSPVKKVRMNSH